MISLNNNIKNWSVIHRDFLFECNGVFDMYLKTPANTQGELSYKG